MQINARGAFPKGGAVVLTVPIVRELIPVHIIDEGLVARVNGTAFGAKVSPTIVNRLIDSARGVLNNLLPDVYITSDHVKGQNSGNSAGYSVSLVSESNTGVLLSAEHTAGGPRTRRGDARRYGNCCLCPSSSAGNQERGCYRPQSSAVSAAANGHGTRRRMQSTIWE